MDQSTNSDKNEMFRFEYEMAQDMVKHYDNLNWVIGSVLIGAVLVLTGVAISGALQTFPGISLAPAILVSCALPLMSFVVLRLWHLWFKRHQSLYNIRNEVMQRIEFDLMETETPMYNHLLVQRFALDEMRKHANVADESQILAALEHNKKAALRVGYVFEPKPDDFRNYCDVWKQRLHRPAGHTVANWLIGFLPLAQLVVMLALAFLLYKK